MRLPLLSAALLFGAAASAGAESPPAADPSQQPYGAASAPAKAPEAPQTYSVPLQPYEANNKYNGPGERTDYSKIKP